MRHLAIIALATIAALLTSQLHAEASPAWKRGLVPPRFQLVGFTSAAFTGGQGVLGFTNACQAESFPGSRMCSSIEVMETVAVRSGLTGDAWVRPTFQPTGGNTLDASGRNTNPAYLTCDSWRGGQLGPRTDNWGRVSPSALTGLSVSAAGVFVLQGCGVAQSVACCAPVP